MLTVGACGTSGAEWTKVEEYNDVRADLGDPPSPPLKLHAGAVRVAGTVTYNTAGRRYFDVALAPRDPGGPGRVHGLRLVFRATDDPRTEAFSGTSEDVEAGEYWLIIMSPPATCDVTVCQKGGH